MALILHVDIPAGPTIEEAIRECVIFAKEHRVMVKTEINDVPMLICCGGAFGNDIEECTQLFLKEFQVKHNTKPFSPKEYYEKLLKDPDVQKIIKERNEARHAD